MDSWTLAAVAAVVVAFAAVSRRSTESPITPAIVFVSAGILLGNEVLGWIDLGPENAPVRILAEATLTLVLFADASRIDMPALRRGYAVPARLLGIGLPLTIVAGTALAAGIYGQLSLAEAVVLAVVLAPTDAALGQAVVTDPRLPSRIRQGLNVESGLNDGICVPLLFIALAVAEADAHAVSGSHAVHLVVEEIGYGILGGAIAGAATALVARLGDRRELIEPTWLQILPVGGAALAYGLAAPLGGSGFIAAFVGGMVFGGLRRRAGGELTYLLEENGELLNGVTLVVFGAAILGPALPDLTWKAVVYAVLSLTAVRILPVAVAMLGTGARLPTVAYLGWFGPRGLASIVFGVILVEEADLPHTQPILLAIIITIALSVYAHGLSARPLTDRYVRWFSAHPRPPAMESVPAEEHRWRWSQRPRPSRASSNAPR